MPAGLSIKANAPELLKRQLSKRAEKKEYGIIAIGSSTDPYMPQEEEYRLTRSLLEIILRYRFPVEVITKSTLVTRDLDLLKKIDEAAILPPDLSGRLGHGAIAAFSLSTVDEAQAGVFEPGAPSPLRRLETMRECKDSGVMVGVNFIPVLPFLSDDSASVDRMIGEAKEYGADYVLLGGLTLFGENPGDCKVRYYETLEKHYPALVEKYRSLFGTYSGPPRAYQDRLEEMAKKACDRHRITYGIMPPDVRPI